MARLLIKLRLADRKTRRAWSTIWVMCISESSYLCRSCTVGWLQIQSTLYWLHKKSGHGHDMLLHRGDYADDYSSEPEPRVFLVLPPCTWTTVGKPKPLQFVENIFGELGSRSVLQLLIFVLAGCYSMVGILVCDPWSATGGQGSTLAGSHQN